ncbi:DUF1972 domain-containing protein [Sulfitobacter sp. JBTF-M27]|uniref:DUF1972 domain-containing protein n=2 Tax=Sulfitobacter sediminilitoris TaxID=2698830 RepID=A0A6P0CKR9_9RHOB|nr:DUF1972 domain-containing protein [Sulfitobacter sediminilitoris]
MIFIVGIVGVPNNYGGFEALAENLVERFSRDNIPTTVFCEKHFSKSRNYLPDIVIERIGFSANGFQSILYDLIGMVRAARQGGTILLLGTSATAFLPLIRILWPTSKVVVNMAGMEWKRSKWGWIAKKYLKLGEYAAVKFSDKLVVDNQGLAEYVKKSYGVDPGVIPYGGDQFSDIPKKISILEKYNISPFEYDFALARAQPDNNIEMILDAYSRVPKDLLFISNWSSSTFGREILERFQRYSNIRLIGPVYDPVEINTLRSFSRVYIHGHSAGGTNPTLVEAMHAELPIVAFDVNFNRHTTENAALFFKDSSELESIINNLTSEDRTKVAMNLKEIAERRYRWDQIYEDYLGVLLE